jgi:Uma2 family endonuclease
MVLEVVSKNSVRKDTKVLRELYWRAQIPEYWLVDARNNRTQFDILRRTRRGYVAAQVQRGWRRSDVLGKEFRLRAGADEIGPHYSLLVREG